MDLLNQKEKKRKKSEVSKRGRYKCAHWCCCTAQIASNSKMRTAWLFLGLLAVAAARSLEVSLRKLCTEYNYYVPCFNYGITNTAKSFRFICKSIGKWFFLKISNKEI